MNSNSISNDFKVVIYFIQNIMYKPFWCCQWRYLNVHNLLTFKVSLAKTFWFASMTINSTIKNMYDCGPHLILYQGKH